MVSLGAQNTLAFVNQLPETASETSLNSPHKVLVKMAQIPSPQPSRSFQEDSTFFGGENLFWPTQDGSLKNRKRKQKNKVPVLDENARIARKKAKKLKKKLKRLAKLADKHTENHTPGPISPIRSSTGSRFLFPGKNAPTSPN
jgi:hypothetical protein